MKNIYLNIFAFYVFVLNICNAQITIQQDFETGTSALCQCPSGFTCFNDAGRVVDGIQTVYVVGDLGCVGLGPLAVNHTSSLGAHSGIGYVYFYAGTDQIRSLNQSFSGGEQIELCTWYCGPQNAGPADQNSGASHFSFGVDGAQVSPNVLVPTNTIWTKYSYTVTMTPGNHNFSILSGGVGQYVMWFDDLSIVDVCSKYSLSLGNDTTLCSGEFVQLNIANASSTYLWFDNSTSSTYTINQPGKYWTTVTTNNCSYTDTINISKRICESTLEMPNVFTPNNDGVNDHFRPFKLSGINKSTLLIYNRWGIKLFESNDVVKGWDGMYNDSNCSDGVYFWLLQYTTDLDEIKSLKGFLTLIN